MTREEYEFNYNKLQLTGKDAISRLYIKSIEKQLADYKKRIEDLEAPRGCEWEYYSDEFGNTYNTQCGGLFSITEGNPSENNMKFCPYCGAKIIEQKVLQ